MMKDSLESYCKLRDEIDLVSSRLWKIHRTNMRCSEGCSSCCQAFRILPIEFFSIEILLKKTTPAINAKANVDECKFLVNNRCAIYEHRPIICRTHGFPLVRFNEADDSYEVAYCHLNFINVDLKKFKKSTVYFEEKYNIKLVKLNQKFQSGYPAVEKKIMGLLEINKLQINTI
jgi:uncharacterized protein